MTTEPRVPASSEPRPENPYPLGGDFAEAWGEGFAARQPEVDRLSAAFDAVVAECAVCEKCGHAQPEPNWCHLCGHRTTPPEWAKPLLDAWHEREGDKHLARPATEKLVSLTREGRDWATEQALATPPDEDAVTAIVHVLNQTMGLTARSRAVAVLAAVSKPYATDEAAIRSDERERLSARVYENGWCPTCADFISVAAASPDERLREAGEDALVLLEAMARAGDGSGASQPDDVWRMAYEFAIESAGEIAPALRAALAATDREETPMTDMTLNGLDGLEAAWAVIANAYGGDWTSAPDDWRAAAERWRDEVWHPALDASRVSPDGIKQEPKLNEYGVPLWPGNPAATPPAEGSVSYRVRDRDSDYKAMCHEDRDHAELLLKAWLSDGRDAVIERRHVFDGGWLPVGRPFFTEQQERNLARCEAFDRASEPRPENPVPVSPEPERNPYRTVHARMSPPGAAWDEGFAAGLVSSSRNPLTAAFDAVVAERDEARAEVAAFRQFTADQIERAGSMSELQEDQIEAQIRDAGRDRIELDKRARRLAHLERALKHLREFVQDGEVRRIIDAALGREDWE